MIICDFCKEKKARLEMRAERLDSLPGIWVADLGKNPKDICVSCRDKIWEMDLREPTGGIASEINWEAL